MNACMHACTQALSKMDALPGFGWQTRVATDLFSSYPGLSSAPGRLLANTMYTLACLNYRPASSWVCAAESSLQPRMLIMEPAGEGCTSAQASLNVCGCCAAVVQGAWGCLCVDEGSHERTMCGYVETLACMHMQAPMTACVSVCS